MGTATLPRLESPSTALTSAANAVGSCAALPAAKKLPLAALWNLRRPVCSACEIWLEDPDSVTSRRLEETEATVRWLAAAQVRMASTVAVAGANWAANWAGVSAAWGVATSAFRAPALRSASTRVTDMRDAL